MLLGSLANTGAQRWSGNREGIKDRPEKGSSLGCLKHESSCFINPLHNCPVKWNGAGSLFAGHAIEITCRHPLLEKQSPKHVTECSYCSVPPPLQPHTWRQYFSITFSSQSSMRSVYKTQSFHKRLLTQACLLDCGKEYLCAQVCLSPTERHINASCKWRCFPNVFKPILV